MSDIIFSVSGVRGIYGESFTLEIASHYTLAFAKFLRDNFAKPRHLVVVGRDGREKGEEIASVVMNSLSMAGFDVLDIGIVPTPTVQLAVENLKASGGIAITASHNPQQWNGLKFLEGNGTFLKSTQIEKVKKNIKLEKFSFVKPKNFRTIKKDTKWLDKHISLVLKSGLLDISKIKKRKFKVVVDAVNSAGSVIVPKLLKLLGCEVIELYCDSSGIFPHTPEPLPENLTLLSEAVIKHKADFGFAIDPDSDRLVIICENGKPFIEENTIVTSIRSILRNSQAKIKNVVVNLSTTRAAEDVTKEFGGMIFKTAVGEINVVNEMIKQKAIIGGEGSGGVIVPKVHYGRDAIVGIALVLNELANFQGKISEYKKTIPEYFILKTKISSVDNPDEFLKKVLKKYSKTDCIITQTDGIKLDFPEYWIHLRKSNTEPIIRIIVEAKSEEKAKQYLTEFNKNL